MSNNTKLVVAGGLGLLVFLLFKKNANASAKAPSQTQSISPDLTENEIHKVTAPKEFGIGQDVNGNATVSFFGITGVNCPGGVCPVNPRKQVELIRETKADGRTTALVRQARAVADKTGKVF